MPSAAMLTHLQSNVTFLIPIWSITSVEGEVARYAGHTRNVTFGGQDYSAAPVEPTRFSQTFGVLEANHIELFGVFDTVISEDEVQGGKWKNAPIVFEYIAYDPATGAASATVTGSVQKMKGKAGKFSVNNGTFRVELRSLSDGLQQDIGSLTSGLDRNRSVAELGINVAPFTFARAVTASPDRRNFTVDGAAQVDDYFAYGVVTFTSGANSGLRMEIKSSVGNVIELQLPMRSTITIGDTCSLVAGYNSTREQCRDKFSAMVQFDGECDLPGIRGVIAYPE